MITVGLIHELEFMSSYFDEEVSSSISIGKNTIEATVYKNKLLVFYKGQKIWEEGVHGEGAWFGVESADTIHKITNHIDEHGDESWKDTYVSAHYIETDSSYSSLQEALSNVDKERKVAEAQREARLALEKARYQKDDKEDEHKP